ncbi:hypothetical protein HDV01_001215 [Terramyces sp. JEL0728]|nr:hypothetical protein HDV01_001215 [Terramyces sp. JEL0728]
MNYCYVSPSPLSIKPLNQPLIKQTLLECTPLPLEVVGMILARINNCGFKQVQSKWDIADMEMPKCFQFLSYEDFRTGSTACLNFNAERQLFEVAENPLGFMPLRMGRIFSAYEILYRALCFFPGVGVNSLGTSGYKLSWTIYVVHKETGFGLAFSEWKGATLLRYCFLTKFCEYFEHPKPFSNAKISLFVNDLAELLNIFFATYFHPSAVIANHHTARYVNEPSMCNSRGEYEECLLQERLFGKFKPTSLSNDKVFEMNTLEYTYSGSHLGQCISSGLLFYCLLSAYKINDHKPVIQDGVVGVWSVALKHKEGNVVMMDEHGLATVRVSKNIGENANKDLIAILDLVCSGKSQHPYDCVINGSVA